MRQHRIIQPPEAFLEAMATSGLARAIAGGLYVRACNHLERYGHSDIFLPELLDLAPQLLRGLDLPPGWLPPIVYLHLENECDKETGVHRVLCHVKSPETPSRLYRFLNSHNIRSGANQYWIYRRLFIAAFEMLRSGGTKVCVPLDAMVTVATGCVVHIVCQAIFSQSDGGLPVLENVLQLPS